MGLPPSANTPNLLQLWQWILTPLKFLHSYEQQCGDIFTINMTGGFKEAVFVSNPQTVQQLLTSDTKQFSAPGSSNGILQPLVGNRGVIQGGIAAHGAELFIYPIAIQAKVRARVQREVAGGFILLAF